MQAMLARVTSRSPTSVSALHHARAVGCDRVWRRLRAVLRSDRGFILDGTSFRNGDGVGGRRAPIRGALADCECQWRSPPRLAGMRGVVLGRCCICRRVAHARGARAGAHPSRRPVSEKCDWRCVCCGTRAPAAHADRGAGRCRIRRCHRISGGAGTACGCPMPSALVASDRLRHPAALVRPAPTPRGRPRTRWRMVRPIAPIAVRALIAQVPPSAWRRVTCQRRAAQTPGCFTAVRVTRSRVARRRLVPRLAALQEEREETPLNTTSRSSVWLRCGRRPLTHQRWAIEQQYQELKSELGLDTSTATWPGCNTTRVDGRAHAYTTRADAPWRSGVYVSAVRAIVQENFTALFCAKPRYMLG